MLEMVDLTQSLTRKEYNRKLNEYQTKMRYLGYEMYRQQRPVVIAFEGWDAAGKGGAINRLTERLDPRGYIVYPIAAPSGDDAEKHYLFRFWRRLPPRGVLAIFDRTWYGRVLVERIEGFATEAEWQRAFAEIVDFERQLTDYGTIVFKFWLHISQEEQAARFALREETPYKKYKLTEEDWRNREKWDQYRQAVEDMLIKTTTRKAPWTVIAGNEKYFARVQVLQTVVEKLAEELHVDFDVTDWQQLPAHAATVPMPEWAREEARKLGILNGDGDNA